jgi:hypothetical protein
MVATSDGTSYTFSHLKCNFVIFLFGFAGQPGIGCSLIGGQQRCRHAGLSHFQGSSPVGEEMYELCLTAWEDQKAHMVALPELEEFSVWFRAESQHSLISEHKQKNQANSALVEVSLPSG